MSKQDRKSKHTATGNVDGAATIAQLMALPKVRSMENDIRAALTFADMREARDTESFTGHPLRSMDLAQLSSINPGNPFHSDLYHMGTQIGNNVTVMFANTERGHCDYLIVVNTETGERLRVTFHSERR